MKQKPYHLLLWTAGLLFVASFFTLTSQGAVDIHLHDTYFIIANTHVFRLLALMGLLVWGLYRVTGKVLYSKWLSWVHVIITVVTLLLIASSSIIYEPMNQIPVRAYYDNRWTVLDKYGSLTKAIGFTIMLSLPGQIVYMINLVAGLIKKFISNKIKNTTKNH